MEDARNQSEPAALEDDGEGLSTIDLANPTEVNLWCRAVTANWTISDHVRAQVRDQLPAALAPDAPRSDKQVKKLESLAVAVGMKHLIGVARPAPSFSSKRNPNRRQLRPLGRQRAREALHAQVLEAKES
jgi:hypothetical protein